MNVNFSPRKPATSIVHPNIQTALSYQIIQTNENEKGNMNECIQIKSNGFSNEVLHQLDKYNINDSCDVKAQLIRLVKKRVEIALSEFTEIETAIPIHFILAKEFLLQYDDLKNATNNRKCKYQKIHTTLSLFNSLIKYLLTSDIFFTKLYSSSCCK